MLNEQFKKINELSFQMKTTKDEKKVKELDSEIKKIITDLKKQAIENFKDESDIKKFLDNIIKFNNYSLNNQLLIYMQKPDSQYVSSLKNFSKLGYKINKGAKGIKILIPTFYNIVKIKNDDEIIYKPYFTLTEDEKKKYKDKTDETITFDKQVLSGFSIGHVFDASDTNMPLDIINAELDPVLEYNGADEIMDCFIKTIYKDGFKVQFEDMKNSGAKGYCDHKENKIVIKKGLGNLMQLQVLIHEYGHALAHKHLKDNYIDYKLNRNKYETEAESISYVVSKYLGLPTNNYSLNYLYAWSKEKDFKEIDDSLTTIVNFSKRIIKNFEKFYDNEFGLYAEDLKKINI